MNYATVEEIELLWRPMSDTEKTRAEALLPIICDSLRMEAKKVGKDLDVLIGSNPELGSVAKSVTVDVVARTLMTSTNAEPLSQFSEAAMGYSVSGTYLNPGGGLFIKKAELARLGIRVQKFGAIDMMGGWPN